MLTLVTLAIVAANYLLAGMPARRGRPKPPPIQARRRICRLAAGAGRRSRLGLLSRTLRVALFHDGRRLWRGFHGGQRDALGALGHGRRCRPAVCALCGQRISFAVASPPGGRRGVYVAAWIVGVDFAPGLFQKFVVEPSELAMEKPYLTNYIDSTREAYPTGRDQGDLLSRARGSDARRNRAERGHDPEHPSLGLAAAAANLSADPGDPPLLPVLQCRYRPLSSRRRLPSGDAVGARTLPRAPRGGADLGQSVSAVHPWLRLVMNFVSKTVGGGFPALTARKRAGPIGLRPEDRLSPPIYYGESMPGYRIVDTEIKEFDYPKGNDNVYTSYAGTGGIRSTASGSKLLFAWNKADINILLTSYLKPGEPHPDSPRRARARGPDRAVPAARQRSLSRAERRQALLDPGRLYRLELLSLFEPAGDGAGRGAEPAERRAGHRLRSGRRPTSATRCSTG